MFRVLLLLASICSLSIATGAKADPYCEERIGTPEACDPWLYDVFMKAKVTKIESYYTDYFNPDVLRNDLNPESINVGDDLSLYMFFDIYYIGDGYYEPSFAFALNDIQIDRYSDLDTLEIYIRPSSIEYLWFSKYTDLEGLTYNMFMDGSSYGPSNITVWSDANLDFNVRNFRGIIGFDYWGEEYGIYHHVYFETEYPGRFSPVPEPASWLMLIAGFGLVGAAIRRRVPVSLRA